MNIQETMKSKTSKIIALSVGVILVALVSFGAGVGVGLHKAKFSYKFGENYERNFIGGPMGMMGPGGFPGGMMRNFQGRGFRNGHGIAGSIVSVSNNQIVLKDHDGQENTISVSDKTLIKRGRDTISINDLKNDEQIVVMGRPGENGTVNADLIRVFDNGNN